MEEVLSRSTSNLTLTNVVCVLYAGLTLVCLVSYLLRFWR